MSPPRSFASAQTMFQFSLSFPVVFISMDGETTVESECRRGEAKAGGAYDF